MIVTIDPDEGYEQELRIQTLEGSFSCKLKFNVLLRLWVMDITNDGSGRTLFGFLLRPGRRLNMLRRIGFVSLLWFSQTDDFLYIDNGA